MTRALLLRGMLVGLVAGVLALIFSKIFGEPHVDLAIAFEEAHSAAEVASRDVQSTIGLATAILAYAVAYGGIFALVFAYANGRIGKFRPRVTAGLLALGGFVVVVFVPFVKYPANPPSVVNPDTLGQRTVLYFSMIAISILVAVAAILIGRALAPRFGNWNATLLAIGGYVVVIAVAYVVLPVIQETPEEFPAVVLWNFRLASLGTQIVLWSTLGLLFGGLTERSLQRTAAANSAAGRSAAPS